MTVCILLNKRLDFKLHVCKDCLSFHARQTISSVPSRQQVFNYCLNEQVTWNKMVRGGQVSSPMRTAPQRKHIIQITRDTKSSPSTQQS